MSAFKSDFLNILQERGFVHQCSDFEGLDALAAKGRVTPDLGGSGSTETFADALIERLRS